MTWTITRLVAALAVGAGVVVAGSMAEARSGIVRGHPGAGSSHGDSISITSEQSAAPSTAVHDDRGDDHYPDRAQDGAAARPTMDRPAVPAPPGPRNGASAALRELT